MAPIINNNSPITGNFSKKNFLSELKRIARAAGDIILEIYERGSAVEFKDNKSPLTEADKAAHQYIVSELTKFTSDIPIVSEESDSATWENINNNIESWEKFWLVDPLDGTKEFIKKSGEFTVNIALIENKLPTVGVVFAPAIFTMYAGSVEDDIATKQVGAPDSEEQSISTKKSLDEDNLRVVASKDHAGPAVTAMIENLPGKPELKSMGSSLKFCLVAEGEADIYPRLLPTMEWDTAAAHAVVRAAGGQIFTSTGDEFKYGKPGLRNDYFICLGQPALEWSKYLPVN